MVDLCITFVIAVVVLLVVGLFVLLLDRWGPRWMGRFKQWSEVEALLANGQGVLIFEEPDTVKWCPVDVEDTEVAVAVAFYAEAFSTNCPKAMRNLKSLIQRFSAERVFHKTIDVTP